MYVVMQNYRYSTCGVVSEELNPRLPFGDHLLGNFFFSLIGTRGFELHFPLFALLMKVFKRMV
jgi:hypothetical protein